MQKKRHTEITAFVVLYLRKSTEEKEDIQGRP